MATFPLMVEPLTGSLNPLGFAPPRRSAPHTPSTPHGKCIASRFRTKLCDKWLDKGQCPYGARCMFAHGPQELRTTEMNLRDGLTDEETIRAFKRFVQLRNAGIAVEVPACLQQVDWGAGRRFILAPPTEARDAVRSPNPTSFRWCPYSTTNCRVFFDDSRSQVDSGRVSPAHSAESASSAEFAELSLSPLLEYEI